MTSMRARDVLAFARSGARTYDEIATRVLSRNSGGPSPLRVIGREVRRHQTPEAGERLHLSTLRESARPLSFDVSPEDGHFYYEITADRLQFRLQRDGRSIIRRTSHAHPPSILIAAATQAPPPPPVMAQQARMRPGSVPAILWLPFPALLEQGRFVRMQANDRLTARLEPDGFYLFVSHRWLDLRDPDPDGGQAAAVAWQVVAEFVEAVWLCAARKDAGGRLRFDRIDIGLAGSELAESLVVNLVGPTTDDQLADLKREAESFADVEGDRGLRCGREDPGLARLRVRLDRAPALSRLLGRVRLWYDFACMPQHPWSAEEQERFEAMLGQLGMVQMLGRTVVLLDDLVDYLGRGWCSYEAVLASEYVSRTLDVWAGSRRPRHADAEGGEFLALVQDRSHLLWRAILDTELFDLQTPDECMERLGLATTRPEDRGIVYGLLRQIGLPRSLHYDDGEVVTGVFPMPIVNGRALTLKKHSRSFQPIAPVETRTIDFPAVAHDIPRLGPSGISPWIEYQGPAGKRGNERIAHAAVFGSCEGEAILLAHWLHERRASLETELGCVIATVSWLASDIAPVGHFPLGTLSIRSVPADYWILVGTHANLEAGYVTTLLMETLSRGGIAHARVVVDGGSGNLRMYEASDNPGLVAEDGGLMDLDPDDPRINNDLEMLFRPQFVQHLGIRP